MHKKLFIPGPVDVRPEVLAKMSTPMISHRGKAATELGKDVCKIGRASCRERVCLYV